MSNDFFSTSNRIKKTPFTSRNEKAGVKKNSVYLRGFGTFLAKKKAKKMGRNITKNTAILIPEHFAPYFKPSKSFVNKVKEK